MENHYILPRDRINDSLLEMKNTHYFTEIYYSPNLSMDNFKLMFKKEKNKGIACRTNLKINECSVLSTSKKNISHQCSYLQDIRKMKLEITYLIDVLADTV